MTDIRTPIGPLRPYHIYPLIVYLRDHYRELDDETRRALMAHVAMHSADPAAVSALADIHEDAWGSLYPREATVTPGTADTIDKFIATYGHPSAEDDALLERLILNPTPDYGAVLADEDAAESGATSTPDATAAGIEGFLGAHGVAEVVRAKVTAEAAEKTPSAAQPAAAAVAAAQPAAEVAPAATSTAASAEPAPAPVADEDTSAPAAASADNTVTPADETAAVIAETEVSAVTHTAEGAVPAAVVAKNTGKGQTPASSLSESLAKIYIRQGKYRRAYEILSDLNLKNPEKSIYFADQLRFLRKVISLLPPEQEGEGGV